MSTEPEVKTTHRFVVVLNKKIDPGVAVNACAHMVACLVARADTATRDEMSFVDYVDADQNVHPVSALSLIVLSARNSNQLRTARAAADASGIPFVDFTESMTQDTYVEQMERTSRLAEEELEYYGLAMFGPASEINPITKKFSMWR